MSEITEILSTQSAAPPMPLRESPLNVLEAKARELRLESGGLLVGYISAKRNDYATLIHFGMTMPAMDDAYQGLMHVIYPNDCDYPVWVHAPEFPGSLKLPPYHLLTPEQEKEDFVAHNPEEFRSLIDKVLSSEENRGLIELYINQSKEILQEQQREAAS